MEHTIDTVLAKDRPRPAPVPMSSKIPEPPADDYAELAAWYSGFSFCEHYRSVVLAQAREVVRARAAVEGIKQTEARTDDLARLEPSYSEYLAKHLKGRTAWEREFLAHGGMR